MIEDFFDNDWDWDLEDFAIIGGAIGFIEEELEEKRRRRKRELNPDYDPIYNPDDDGLYL